MLKPKPILFYGCRGTSQLNTPINNTLKHTINSHLGSIQFKRTVCRITAILMLISSTFGAVASTNKGDKPGDAPTRIMNSMRSAMVAPSAMGYPAHYGNSPFPFSDMFSVTGDIVINDKDSSTLDRYLYRSGSDPQIKIPLNVSRYIGDKDKLLAKGLLSKQATIVFPGYDVDSQTSPVSDCDGDGIPDQLRPEVNKVYFNGELIGEMTGDNNIWRMQRFSIDISLVNFPSTPGSTAENELSIAIDAANKNVPLSSGAVGCRVWATEIDWAALQFEAASPVVLVPGLMGRTDSFEESGYIQALKEEGLPVELVELNLGTSSFKICAGDGLSMLNQADVLRQKVSEIAKKYGSESVNLIGHSKGGLDSRAFAHLVRNTEIPVHIRAMSGQPLYAQLKVPSIVTHGTPHQGTVLADKLVVDVGVANFLFSDLCALTTYGMEKFNQTYPVPSDLRVFAIGAEADKNGNGVMEGNKNNPEMDEIDGHQVNNPLANNWYQLNRRAKRVVIVDYQTIILPHLAGTIIVPEVVMTPTRIPELNDGMVTVASATELSGVIPHVIGGLNHGTVLSDKVTQGKVIDAGATGFLQWRKK